MSWDWVASEWLSGVDGVSLLGFYGLCMVLLIL